MQTNDIKFYEIQDEVEGLMVMVSNGFTVFRNRNLDTVKIPCQWNIHLSMTTSG